MFCLRCEYTLNGLTEPVCPECGRPFAWDDPRSFARRPGVRVRRRQWVVVRAGAVAAWVIVAALLQAIAVGLVDLAMEHAAVERLAAGGVSMRSSDVIRPIRRAWRWADLDPRMLDRVRWVRIDQPSAAQIDDLRRLRYVNRAEVAAGSSEAAASVTGALARRLEYLTLTTTGDPSALAETLHAAGPLRGLTLRAPALRDQHLTFLASMPGLTSLDLADSQVGGSGLANVASPTVLRELVLSGCPIDGAGMAALARFTGLTKLRLDRTPVEDDHLAAITGMAQLFSLDLSETRITDLAFARMPATSSLDLRIARTRIVGWGLGWLPEPVNGLGVDARGTRLRDVGLWQLTRFDALLGLDVGQTDVTEAGLRRYVSQMPRLRVLGVAGVAMTDAEARTLSWPHGLQRLDVSGCGLDEATLGAIARRCGRLTALHYGEQVGATFGEAEHTATPQTLQGLRSMAALPRLGRAPAAEGSAGAAAAGVEADAEPGDAEQGD